MPTVEFKNGETKEIPEDQMQSFLKENRHLIRERRSSRKRPILGKVSATEISKTK